MSPHVRYLGEIRVIFPPGYSEREFLENLLGAVGIPIVVINRQANVALWNDAFALASRRTDETTDLVVGNHLSVIIPELSHPIRQRDWIATAMDVMATGQSYFEKRVPLRLGADAPSPHDFAVHALTRRDGAVVGAVLVMANVSEQVMLEDRLLRIARTTSLANLGASVAHEIRNPLNSIGLNLQRLQEKLEAQGGHAEDGTLGLLGMVGDEVRRLERIVKDFLKFSRPPQAHRQPVDVRKLVMRCLSVFAEEARASGIELRHNLGAMSEIPIDPDLITQAFQNLLLNAIQAARETPEGRVRRVDVEGFETADAVAIAIRDSGPGLPTDEEREKIFDLFYSTKEAGTGLGLAIANRFVEDHGGSITAANEQAGGDGAGGAVFTIYLPKVPPGRREGEAAAEPREELPRAPE